MLRHRTSSRRLASGPTASGTRPGPTLGQAPGSGRSGLRKADQSIANRTVAEAVGRGINYFDVAPSYGNAEQMLDRTTNQAHTAHTLNLVPFLYIGRRAKMAKEGTGALQDVAPTLLAMMGLPQPPEMTGKPLIHIL